MNYLLHFRHLGFIGFFLCLFILSIPTQASIIQLDCKEKRSFVIKSRSEVGNDDLIKKEPSKFRENDPKGVWKVSYDLKSGKGSINKSTAKLIRVSDPSTYSYAPAFLYSENSALYSKESDRGFGSHSEMTKTNMQIRIDSPSGTDTSYFAVIVNENTKDSFNISALGEIDNSTLEVDETIKISMGYCYKS